MALARARRERSVEYWPGFVDALSTLVLGIVFLLSTFVVVQFYLSQEVTGKDQALARLNAQIAELTQLLSMEKTGKASLEEMLTTLRASLTNAEGERDRFKGLYEGLGSGAADAQGKATALAGQLDTEKQISARALAQVELLFQRGKLAPQGGDLLVEEFDLRQGALEDALEASEKKDKEAQGRIADLGQRLNVALAQRVQELSRYRSEFFGRLRTILGNRQDIRVVGDRFVFQSEVLFDTGSAAIRPEGKVELDKLAAALTELEKQIPPEIAWVLRIDGHTDMRPIASPQFPSNWELSSARAISVVQYLISRGISPQRLVAAGFGEFQPLDTGTSEDAYRRNRRIELKLTER